MEHLAVVNHDQIASTHRAHIDPNSFLKYFNHFVVLLGSSLAVHNYSYSIHILEILEHFWVDSRVRSKLILLMQILQLRTLLLQPLCGLRVLLGVSIQQLCRLVDELLRLGGILHIGVELGLENGGDDALREACKIGVEKLIRKLYIR